MKITYPKATIKEWGVKITYPQATIWRARADAEDHGHRFKGKGKRIGLSYILTCQECRHSIVVTPAWYPWEQDAVSLGTGISGKCGA